jgi:hypothetical protein
VSLGKDSFLRMLIAAMPVLIRENVKAKFTSLNRLIISSVACRIVWLSGFSREGSSIEHLKKLVNTTKINKVS